MPDKNEKSIAECQNLIEKHEATCKKEQETLDALRESLKGKAEPLLKKRADLEEKLIPLKQNVAEAKSDYDVTKRKLELYTSSEESEKANLEQLKETLKTKSETLKSRTEQVKQFSVKIPATEKSLKQAQNELNNVKQLEVESSGRLKQYRIKYDEQKSAMTASRTRGRVLDALMGEAQNGNIPGIFGRMVRMK